MFFKFVCFCYLFCAETNPSNTTVEIAWYGKQLPKISIKYYCEICIFQNKHLVHLKGFNVDLQLKRSEPFLLTFSSLLSYILLVGEHLMTMKIRDTLDLEDQDKSMFCFILFFFAKVP